MVQFRKQALLLAVAVASISYGSAVETDSPIDEILPGVGTPTESPTQRPILPGVGTPTKSPADEPTKTPKHHHKHDDSSSSSSSSSSRSTNNIIVNSGSSAASPKGLLATTITVGLVSAMVAVFMQ